MTVARNFDSEIFNKLHNEDHLSLRKIAKMYNTTHEVVKKYLLKGGYSYKKRTYELKEDFFESLDSLEKFYFLGWIYSDGCVFNYENKGAGLSIKIQERDKYILEYFAKLMGSTRPLIVEEMDGRYYVDLTVGSKQIFNDLCKYGLHERKTFDKESNNQMYCISGKDATAKIVCDNNRTMIVACGKLYNHKLKEMLNYPIGKLNEDEYVTYKLLYNVDKVVISSKKYYYYLQRINSIMSSEYSEKRLAKLEALKESIDYFELLGDRKLLNAAKLRYFLNLQISWYRVNKSKIKFVSLHSQTLFRTQF